MVFQEQKFIFYILNHKILHRVRNEYDQHQNFIVF